MPHVARKIHAFLKGAMFEYGFKLMVWPSNSLDINLIENLWAHFKLHLHRQYPDIKHLCRNSEVIKMILKQRLMEVLVGF